MQTDPRTGIRDDVLGTPYTAETIPLGYDDEGEVVATLVHRAADPGARTRRGAVLHVHGFADYFFHTEYAEWWCGRGYDFYAVDLRKYGRSLRPHQTPNFITDLHDYFDDLDETWSRITRRDGHDRVLLSAHSTGGLVVPLWVDDRQPAELGAMVLNSPWFDLRGPVWLRTLGTRVVDQVGARSPRRVIPRRASTLYAEALHREFGGEWDYNLEWKPAESWPIHAGWLRAVRRGHADLHRGLGLRVPVLVLCSSRTTGPTTMNDDVTSSDIVLDVDQIRRWTPALGSPELTVVSIDDAIHDVVLSSRTVRERIYDELDRWLGAYGER